MSAQNLKNLLEFQKKAWKIEDSLKHKEIEAEHKGLVITFDWKLNCLKVDFESKELIWNEKELKEAIQICIDKGIKKAQEIAAESMQDMIWDLWLDKLGLFNK